MKLWKILPAFLLLVIFQTNSSGQEVSYLESLDFKGRISSDPGISKPVIIKVIYDNYTVKNDLKADWGFSLVIEGLEKEILFDAGTRPGIFESNFMKMNIDPAIIDFLILSHEHGDHTDGIEAFAKMKSGIPVIFPGSFSEGFKNKMKGYGYTPTLIKEPAQICEHLYTSGEFKYQIPEQALIIVTGKGLIVITGCSHPGIIEMLKQIKSSFGKDIYMVMGGMHLLNKTENEMNIIISEMKALGIVKCGATHCTGDRQIKMFKDAFGENYVEMGAGNSIVIE